MTDSARKTKSELQAAQAEEPVYEKSAEEIKEEIVAGLKAGGAPDEDIQNITGAMDGKSTAAADDPKVKDEIANGLREGGAPDEDIANMIGQDESNDGK